jgi:hypothetical protein
MKKMMLKGAVLLIALAVVWSFPGCGSEQKSTETAKQEIKPGKEEKTETAAQTQLSLTNNSGQDVKVYITLGRVPGCVADVSDIPFVTNRIQALQGWFMLPNEKTVSYTPPPGTCFNGNYTFGIYPSNCPTPPYTAGINLFEFMLNNGNQPGPYQQETIDISCVPGVNAFIAVTMSGGGTWNAGQDYPDVTSFENKAIGQNTDLVGVYAYGCTGCVNGTPVCPNNPPPCAPNPPKCSSKQNCNVQRDAVRSGGTVHVTFNGWAPPCN